MPSLVNRALALADTDRMAAIRLLEDYLASPTKDPEVAVWALLWAGEQRRLNDDLAPQLLCHSPRLLRRECHASFGNRNAEPFEELLTLMLVQVHGGRV